MCFIKVNTFKPKKNPRALTQSEREAEDKRTTELFNKIIHGDNPIGNSLRNLNEMMPKSLFESMVKDDIRNRKLAQNKVQ